jgi:hypothetical protein
MIGIPIEMNRSVYTVHYFLYYDQYTDRNEMIVLSIGIPIGIVSDFFRSGRSLYTIIQQKIDWYTIGNDLEKAEYDCLFV